VQYKTDYITTPTKKFFHYGLPHTRHWSWKDACVSTYGFHLDAENLHHHHTQDYRGDPLLFPPESDPCPVDYPAIPVTSVVSIISLYNFHMIS
jgi:hypothetical protein